MTPFDVLDAELERLHEQLSAGVAFDLRNYWLTQHQALIDHLVKLAYASTRDSMSTADAFIDTPAAPVDGIDRSQPEEQNA